MAGYTRQSLTQIQDGQDIVAGPLNAEFDALSLAFNATTGHSHNGTAGNGPKINLATSVTGTLPISFVGTSAFVQTLLDEVDATAFRTTIGANDAANLTAGYIAPERIKHWSGTSADNGFVYINNTLDGLTGGKVGLTSTGRLIYLTNNVEVLGFSTAGVMTTGTVPTSRIDFTGYVLPIANGGTGATSAATAKTNLGLVAIASSGSASDLTAGTVPNARISGSYDGIDTLTSNRIRLLTVTDVGETSTGHAFQLGPTNGLNVVMDTNEMMIRNNGALATDNFSFRGAGTFNFVTSELLVNGIRVVKNDGTAFDISINGSAAKLNNQLGSFYQNASNLNAGTLPNARLAGDYSFANLSLSGIMAAANRVDCSVPTGSVPEFRLNRNNIRVGTLYSDTSNNLVIRRYSATGVAEGYIRIDGNGVNDLNYNGYTIWHDGNDGAGSGLDADLLDGQSGSFYQTASNLVGGTLPAARLSGDYTFSSLTLTTRLNITGSAPEIKLLDTTSGEYSARLRVNANNVYFDSSTDDVTFGEVFRFELDTKKGYVAGSIILTDANTTTSYINGKIGYTPANSANSITAGNGLTGGGTLSATRTITLGTPASISNSTSNSVGSTDHTHALSFTAAEVYTGSDSALTSYPLGSVVLVATVDRPNLNASNTLRLSGSNQITNDTTGTALSGTWRCRGGFTASSDRVCLFQRTA